MASKSIEIYSVLLLVAVLVAGTAITGIAELDETKDVEKEPILVDSEIVDRELSEQWGTMLDQYGGHTIIMVEQDRVEEFKEEHDAQSLDHRTELYVKGYEFDRQDGLPDFSEKMELDHTDDSLLEKQLNLQESELEEDENHIYLVQMIGPRNPDWRLELEQVGADIITSVAHYGYEVRMTPEQAEKVEEMEFVEWTGLFQPGFKIAPELTVDLEDELENKLNEVNDDEELQQALKSSQPNFPEELVIEIELVDGFAMDRIEELKEVVKEIKTHTEVSNGLRLRAVIEDQVDILDIARMNDVYYISPYFEPQLHEMSSQIVGGGSWHYAPQWEWEEPEYPPRDPIDPVQPYRHEDPEWDAPAGPLTAQLGYTGEDVLVSVADTGVGDGTIPDAGHEDYTGRVVSGYDWDSRSDQEGAFWDADGHGTGVAGVTLSDSYHGTGYQIDHEELEWTGIESWEDYYASMGVAPEANMHVSRIADDEGTLVIPDDLHEVPEQAIQQEPDLYGQTHSWGSLISIGEYTAQSNHIDAAVRNADRETEEEDPMVITFSAGNEGSRGDGSVTGPGGTAKNTISVGGSENYQPDSDFMTPTDNADEYWPDASRGWTNDNRIKPDIVAPANNILTTYWYDDPDIDPNYVGYAGTSFSSPAAQGGAAMLAEWYEEHPLVEGRPSPSMVRALLANSAYDLPEDHDGDGTIDHIPNRFEGWGRMDLTPFVDHDLDEGGPFMMYDRVDEDMEETYLTTGDEETYTVAPMDSDEPLKISLAWDDAPAEAGSDPALQNNLRLEVEDPEGNIYRGNAFAEDAGDQSTSGYSYPDTDALSYFDMTGDGYDDINNLLNVYIEDPEPGAHEIRVVGHDIPEYANEYLDIPNQDFSLAVQNSFLSEDGIFSMDSDRYAEQDTIEFDLIDTDLLYKDSVDIEVFSKEDDDLRDEIDVTLRGDRTGIAYGSIDIGPEYEDDDDGLYVEHGFEIEAIYYDESMGEEKYAFAEVDGESPLPPTDLNVGWLSEDRSHNSLTWEASEDEDLEEFGGYRIYRSESEDGDIPSEDDWTLIDTVEAGVHEYIDQDMGKYEYTRYWYEVAAVDDVGNEEMTSEPDLEPPAVKLESPVGDEILTSGEEEEIEWYAATGGFQSEIKIEYSTNTADDWEIILENYEVDPGEGSYTWEVDEVEGTKTGSLIQIGIEDVDDNLMLKNSQESTIEFESLANTPWPLVGQNQRRTGQSPIDTENNDGTELWTLDLEANVMSSAAIGPEGEIYVGSTDGNLYAVDPDGTIQWVYETGDIIRESSPAVSEDGTIYIGSDDTNLHAINPDGTEKWVFTEPEGDIYSSPNIADDGTIYVGSHDNNLYAVNPDGTEKWTFRTADSVGSSPAIGEDGTVYVGSYDESLYAINPEDGSEKWSFDEPEGWTLSPPAVAEDGTVYIGSTDGNLYAVNSDGTGRWTFSTDEEIYASPIIAEDGTVYIGSYDDHIYAVDPADGSELWSFETESEVRREGAIGDEGNIYYASLDGNLYAITPEGEEIWTYEVGEDIFTSPAIDEDGTIYFGSHDERLHALGTPTEPQPPSKPTVSVSDREVHLDWDEPADGGSPITNYNIYRDDEKIDQTEVIEEILWIQDGEHDFGVFSVVESDGVVYSGAGDDTVMAYDSEDEEVLWKHEEHGGTVMSVYEADGVVYSASFDQTIIAYDYEEEEVLWQHEEHDSIPSSVFEADGVVYSGALDGRVIAYDSEDEEVLWDHDHHAGLIYDLHVSDGVVYSGATDNSVLAADADNGSMLWEHVEHTDTVEAVYESDGVVYSASLDDTVLAYDYEEEEVLWQHEEHDATVMTVVESDGIVYSGGFDETVIAYDTEEQDILWKHEEHRGTINAVYESDGVVYSGGGDDKIVAAAPELATDGTYYTDTEVENWQEYTYEISAENEVGEGERSIPVRAEPRPELPDPPEGGDISDYITITEFYPPSVDIISPEYNDIWKAHSTQTIEWDTTEGDGTIDSVRIEYSTDGGETWNFIAEEDGDDESFEWQLPEEHSDDAKIRLYLEDEHELFVEEISEQFKIIALEPPENLSVEHISFEDEVLFYDDLNDGEPEDGYETGEYPEGINEWDVREHGAYHGNYSWDFGDGEYQEVEDGGLSWLNTPSIELPEDSIDAELSFQHWREFDHRYDGGNLRISTDTEEWEILEPTFGYPDSISEEFDNPLAGEVAWTGTSNWEEVKFDLGEYAGETIYLNFSAGVDSWEARHEGWRIDDIEVTATTPQIGERYHSENRLTWDSSPDDNQESNQISHYNIYRSEKESELGYSIESLHADGSEVYTFIDKGAGTEDQTTWWYTVRAETEDGTEEEVGVTAQEPIAPYQPVSPAPEDGSASPLKQHESTELSVDLGHGDPETPMDIAFYDAETNELIEEVEELYSGERVKVEWDKLPEGEFSWYVDIQDGDYLVESDIWTFIIDDQKPEVEIIGIGEGDDGELSTPENGDILDYNDVKFSWDGYDELSGIDYFEVRLRDESPWENIGRQTSVLIEGLLNGEYTIEVRATDQAGNQAIDDLDFTIDTQSPTVEITRPDLYQVQNEDEVKVEWYGYDEITGIDHYEVRLDEEEWINVGMNQSYRMNGLEQGDNVIEVRATDLAGNQETSSVMVLYDSLEPVIDIIEPEEKETIEQDWIEVVWTGEDDYSGIKRYELQLNNYAWIELPYEDEEQSYIFDNLQDGDYTLSLMAIDEAGNQAIETLEFTIDTPDAELEITSPEDKVENLIYEEDFTIEGQTDEVSSVYVGGQEIDVDEEGNFEYETILLEGQNVFEVKAEHPDGDVNETKVYALYLPQIPEMQDDIEDLDDEIANNRDAIDDLEDVTDQLEIDISELENELHTEVDRLESALEENVSALEDAIDENKTELIDIIDDNISMIEDELTEINADIDVINTQLDDLVDKLDDLEIYVDEELKELESYVDDEVGELESYVDDEIETLRSELEGQLEDELNDLESYIDDEIGELETYIDNEIEDLKEKLEAEIDDLEEDHEEDISTAFNLGIVGLILAILAVIIAVFAVIMKKKGGSTSETQQKENLQKNPTTSEKSDQTKE